MELSNDPNQGLNADEDIDIELDAVDPQTTDNVDEEMTGGIESPSANQADRDQNGPQDELMLADFASESLDDAHLDYEAENQDVEVDDTEDVSSPKATVEDAHAPRSDEALSKKEVEGTEALDNVSAELPRTSDDPFPTDILPSSQVLGDSETSEESNVKERISSSQSKQEIDDSIINASQSHPPEVESAAALDAAGSEAASDDNRESFVETKETDLWDERGNRDGKYEQDVENGANIGEEGDTIDGADLGSGLQHVHTLHPTIVTYLDTEMSLFPPLAHDTSNPSTFLLQDESLAYGSIQNMLHSLREVLEDGVGEADEVELAIEELGFRVCQVCCTFPVSQQVCRSLT